MDLPHWASSAENGGRQAHWGSQRTRAGPAWKEYFFSSQKCVTYESIRSNTRLAKLLEALTRASCGRSALQCIRSLEVDKVDRCLHADMPPHTSTGYDAGVP